MQIIHSDPTRMIDLPGVGPCPRPVDIDTGVTGFTALRSLRIYRFEAGQTIEGESEADEVFIIPVRGAVTMEISGAHPLNADLAPGRVLYMPRDHGYRLTPGAPSLVAYGRADSTGARPSVALDSNSGAGENLRYRIAEVQGDVALGGSGGETLAYLIDGTGQVNGQTVQAGDTIALPADDSATLHIATPGTLLILTA